MTPSPDPFWTRLERLRGLRAGADVYWPLYLDLLAAAAGASQGFIFEAPAAGGPWRDVCRSGLTGTGSPPVEMLARLAEAAAQKGIVEADLGVGAKDLVLALLVNAGDAVVRLAVLQAPVVAGPESTARGDRLRLVADQPSVHFAEQRVREARRNLAAVSGALDLLNQLNPHLEFQSAVMAFVNEVAGRLPATQAALGWQEGRIIRLKAVSHMERFAPQVELVRDLEAVMEESSHQDDEIVWPTPPDPVFIAREHEQFSRRHGVAHLLSMPLRARGEIVGVVHLHRMDTPFTEDDLARLRVWCDQSAPWLDQLRAHGVWFGSRWQVRGRRALGRIWGVEHAWMKLGVVLSALALILAVFGKRVYRVDAPFILRSANQALIPAPFDGFILGVDHEIGDRVEAGTSLLTLDPTALLQREAGLLADVSRFQGEAERAESAGKFAEMRIAEAQGRQSSADLAVVRYQLEHSILRAPFSGIVMEGRHRERLGASVKQGELLFRVARTDKVYAEIDVDEKDVQEVAEGAHGQVAFTSRPDAKSELRVTNVDPSATTKGSSNVFVVRADLPGPTLDWWRPGMTGVAKVDAGRRSYLWIGTHRLADFLRLKLWWW